MREVLDQFGRYQAIEYCLDTVPGTSNYYFYEYGKALTALVDINQHAMDESIADGEKAIGGWTRPVPYGLVAPIVALVAIGTWPRLAEYR